jgi:hypothetical protein
MPANCRGLEYGSPILIPTKAEDHNKQAIIARDGVLKNILFKTGFFQLKIDHLNTVIQTFELKSSGSQKAEI